MSIDSLGLVSSVRFSRTGSASNMPAKDPRQGDDSVDSALTVTLSDEALALYQQAANEAETSKPRKIDELIASWFKHVSPANSEADKQATAEEDHKKHLARAAGRVWSDPGHVPDPVKEPSRTTLGTAVGIIETDQLLQAMQAKPDHHPDRDGSRSD